MLKNYIQCSKSSYQCNGQGGGPPPSPPPPPLPHGPQPPLNLYDFRGGYNTNQHIMQKKLDSVNLVTVSIA